MSDIVKQKYKYVVGIQCPICDEKIWSKYTHDYHHCECMYSSVDGGRDYLRYGWGVNYINDENTPPDTYEIANEFNQYMGMPKRVRIRVRAEEIVTYKRSWPY